MIYCVLSTDISHHNECLDFMKNLLNENNRNSEFIEKNKQKYINLVIHSSDISNPTKNILMYTLNGLN